MSKNIVKVNPEIYKWVKGQINIEILKPDIREDFNNWIKGIKAPTFTQIKNFSKATHIPLGYFFLNEPPIEENKLIEFRTIDSIELERPSRDLIDTINEMENIQEWMKEHLIKNSADALKFVGSVTVSEDIFKVVSTIRKDLILAKDWYKNIKNSNEAFKTIRKKLVDLGIIVMMNGIVGANTKRKLNIDEFRAFTLVDNYAPLIFINSTDSSNGRLFSLIHELAHIWYGKDSLFNDNYNSYSIKKIETYCNAIAAEIIIPNDIFIKVWNQNKRETIEDRVQKFSNEFNCSMMVIARRALDNNFINIIKYKEIEEKAKKIYNENKKIGTGGNYYNTVLSRIDHRVLFALNNSAYAGETQFTDVYRMTNTNRRTFDTLIEQAGLNL